MCVDVAAVTTGQPRLRSMSTSADASVGVQAEDSSSAVRSKNSTFAGQSKYSNISLAVAR